MPCRATRGKTCTEMRSHARRNAAEIRATHLSFRKRNNIWSRAHEMPNTRAANRCAVATHI
eukprot:11213322-Lingulodinium_polyedra.AAC.1